jgi:hypothetical protein
VAGRQAHQPQGHQCQENLEQDLFDSKSYGALIELDFPSEPFIGKRESQKEK